MANYERLRVSRYTGLDVNTAKIHMDDGAARVSRNFDFRRIGAARLRAGYARLYVVDSGRAQIATDDFNRANGTLGANWTTSGTWAVDTNVAKHSATNYAVARYTGSSFQSDQYSGFIIAVASGQKAGPAVRGGSTAAYVFYGYFGVSAFWSIGRVTYGAAPVDLATVSMSTVAGDRIELLAIGTGLYAYKNGILVLSASDSVLTSGSPGMYSESAGTARYDDFAAGNIAPLRSAVKVTDTPTRLFAFERDDDEARLIVANGTRMEQFGETLPEWGT